MARFSACGSTHSVSWGTGECDAGAFLENLDWFMRRRVSSIVLSLFAGSNNPVKELSEALAVFREVYEDEETRRRSTIVVEVCSGRLAPVAVMTALLIKMGRGWAVDACDMDSRVVELSKAMGDRLRLFPRTDVHSDKFVEVLREARSLCDYLVVVAIHSCRTLAVRIMEAFKEVGGDRLLLVPCCAKPSWARKVVGVEVRGYWDWVYALWSYATHVLNLPARVFVAKSMLSEANAVIEVRR